jgi:hypothetical protein
MRYGEQLKYHLVHTPAVMASLEQADALVCVSDERCASGWEIMWVVVCVWAGVWAGVWVVGGGVGGNESGGRTAQLTRSREHVLDRPAFEGSLA